MRIAVPGKTFLLGEYCVLSDGPSLIFTNKPYFSLQLQQDLDPTGLHGIHPNSPAGKLYEANKVLFKTYRLAFDDPYAGLGGLGASSAEFIGVYRAMQILEKKTTPPAHLLNTYWKYAYQNQGTRPSGADIIAQSTGGLCYYHAKSNCLLSFDWPFDALSMFLIHTKHKLSTHHHLRSLTLKNTAPLNQSVFNAKAAMDLKNAKQFIKHINDFSKALAHLNLVAPHTKHILHTLNTLPQVLACKGAGAMGADIVIVFCQRADEEGLRKHLEDLPWPILATHEDLADTTPIRST